MKKILVSLTSIILVLPLLMGMAPADQNKTTQIQVVLHKIAFPEGKLPQDTKNTGRFDDLHAKFLKEYHGLNNVTFDVFDVSREFYDLREQGLTVELVQDQLAKIGPNKERVATGVTQNVSGEDGTLVFSLSATSTRADGKDAVYLFHEAKAPDYIKENSKDLVVALPIYDGDKVMNKIHLYPKNERKTTIPPQLTKVVTDGKATYSFGDKIPFTVTATIPTDLTGYMFYKVTDQADKVLHFNPESLSVTIDGKDVSFLFEKIEQQHGFELNFNDMKNLESYEGKTIVITYTDTLMSRDKVDVEIVNTVSLDTDFDKIVKEVDVKTGGKQFVKVDALDSSKKLAGAEFVVLNEKGDYLSQDTTGFTWTNTGINHNVLKLISDKNGQFEIRGLAYGTYQLREIKAPIGYVLSKEKIFFKVSETSYDQKDGVLRVVNTKERRKNPKTKKTHTGIFPKTNGTFNSKLTWLGVFLVVIVVLAFVWDKRDKNED